MKRLFVLAFAAISAIGAATSGSYAATVGVTSVLPGVDFVDWSVATSSSPQSFVTDGGVTGQANSTGGSLEPRVQGSSWFGNFAPGTPILWTAFTGPDITLVFDSAISGFGATIQANYFGSFVARITDNFGNFFTRTGDSTSNGDGSAIFIGLLSDVANITSITFTLDSASFAPGEFAIGGGVTATAVPIPAGLLLLGAGIPLLAVLGSRKKRGAPAVA